MADINVTLAKYAERADRFDEMKDFMASRVKTGRELDYEERDMFSAAFKSALSGRRQAVRVAMAFENSDQRNAEQANLAAGYRTKVEAELTEVCSLCIDLISNYLLPQPGPADGKVFYLKMMGDYYRYMAEFAEPMKKQEIAQKALEFYSTGAQEALALSPTNPTRLGLALNFSVFLHEVAGQTQEAINQANAAFQAACANAAELATQETRDEASLTMTLLQDNLTLWQS